MWIAKQAATYILGLVLYYIIWKVLLVIEGSQATAWGGINNLSFSIVSGIKTTIKAMVRIIVERDVTQYGFTLYGVLNIFLTIAFVMGFGVLICKKGIYRRKVDFVLLIIAFLSIPFISCIWAFTSDNVIYKPMMMESLCIAIIAIGVLYENYFSVRAKNIVAILLAAVCFNYGIMANVAYFCLSEEYEASYATAIEMVSRIHMLDVTTKKLAIIGDNWSGQGYTDTSGGTVTLLTYTMEENLCYDQVHAIRFINEYLNCDFEEASEQNIQDITQSVEYSEMDVWPASSSVTIIDDVIVIKLSDLDDN